jgi:hypothetical protein
MDKATALEKIKVLTESYEQIVKEGRVNTFNEESTKKDWQSIVVPSSAKLATDPQNPLKQFY